jgi:hypothetical protein
MIRFIASDRRSHCRSYGIKAFPTAPCIWRGPMPDSGGAGSGAIVSRSAPPPVAGRSPHAGLDFVAQTASLNIRYRESRRNVALSGPALCVVLRAAKAGPLSIEREKRGRSPLAPFRAV